MEAIDRRFMRAQQSRKRKIWWGGAAAILLLAGVVIGLVVGLTQRTRGTPRKDLKTRILVPMYSDPADGSWDPLLQQIRSHPKLNFTVIVNPKDGPEIASALPQSYKTTVGTLNALPNARTIGYINTNNSARAIDQVLAEGREYAAWSYPAAGGSFGLEGLYYDNVAPDRKVGEGVDNYFMLLDWIVSVGGVFGTSRFVVHNTGGIPNVFDNTTDITVVFDGSYSEYLERRDALERLDESLRMKRGLFVNSVPSQMTDLSAVVKGMSKIAGYLYLTDRSQDVHSKLGSNWPAFVDAVAKLK